MSVDSTSIRPNLALIRRAGALALVLVALMAAVFATSASASRNLYVTNYESNTISVIDGYTNQAVAGPIAVEKESGPFTIAIAPDGKTAYVVTYKGKSLQIIDTATNTVTGSIPKVGKEGIAITPDGTRAYVGDWEAGTLTAVDLAKREVIGKPFAVCETANQLTISPDGTRAFVSCNEAVVTVDLASNQVIGNPIAVKDPYGQAITPDGKTLFVAGAKTKVGAIDTATGKVTEIPTDGRTLTVVISPDGTRAYVSDETKEKIDIVDTATLKVIGSVPMAGEPEFIAVRPDGARVFASFFGLEGVSGFDTASAAQAFPVIPTGKEPGQLAFVPDQSPAAAITVPKHVRPGVAATLSGAGSTDPDGTIATYAWQFGDGGTASGPASSAGHTFAKPGKYMTTLTLTDNEGCSVKMVYTGQTALCHGSPGAAATVEVTVAYPGVKVKCPKSAGGKGCKYELKAVKKVGKGKKKKLKAQSAVARVKVKAGKSAVVSLKPTKNAAKSLAGAKKTLVQEVATVGASEPTTSVKKLKIVQ